MPGLDLTTRCGVRSQARGFTLMEMIMTTTIVVVAAFLIVPRFGDERRARLIAASRMLESDLEYAQVLSITNPATPVIVRFDNDTNRYWLAFADNPETPIGRPEDGSPYLVTLGQGRTGSAQGVSLELATSGLTGIQFNSYGGVENSSIAPQISLSLNNAWTGLAISPTTGRISMTSGVRPRGGGGGDDPPAAVAGGREDDGGSGGGGGKR